MNSIITSCFAAMLLIVCACQDGKQSSAGILASLSDSVLAHSSTPVCSLGDDANSLERVEQCRAMSGDTAIVIAREPGGTKVVSVSRLWSSGSDIQKAFDSVATRLTRSYGQGVPVCFGNRPDPGRRWLAADYHVTLVRDQGSGRLELNYHEGTSRYKDECAPASGSRSP